MEEPQSLDYLLLLMVANPEDHEMTSFTAMASDMEREQSLDDVVAGFGANAFGPAFSSSNAADKVFA